MTFSPRDRDWDQYKNVRKIRPYPAISSMNCHGDERLRRDREGLGPMPLRVRSRVSHRHKRNAKSDGYHTWAGRHIALRQIMPIFRTGITIEKRIEHCQSRRSSRRSHRR
ncbi:protein of unknown function [Hyphomicrobium sp. MC1]|nr:protein of unknown function [Hyphomicrobium sp. MC1]